MNNPFKSNKEFEKVKSNKEFLEAFRSIGKKVGETYGRNLELKQKLKHMKNCIEYQISEQQVGDQKVDRITFVLSIIVVGIALSVLGNFLPQVSHSLDHTKNITIDAYKPGEISCIV